MLKYPCLVLDHDDTVVRSEATINYPYFVYILNVFRPGATITLEQYVTGCSQLGFVEMCRRWYNFTDEELRMEYEGWKEYIRSHIPAPFPGIGDLIRRQKAEDGLVCVVSMSSDENIRRDYRTHFGLEPDLIFGWDLEPAHRKPSPYALHQIIARCGLRKEDLLVVDDMKPAWEMARAAGVDIAFAAWGRLEYPALCADMRSACDYSFDSVEEFTDFLFPNEV